MSKIEQFERVLYTIIFVALTIIIHPISFVLGWAIGLTTKSFTEGYKDGKKP